MPNKIDEFFEAKQRGETGELGRYAEDFMQQIKTVIHEENKKIQRRKKWLRFVRRLQRLTSFRGRK